MNKLIKDIAPITVNYITCTYTTVPEVDIKVNKLTVFLHKFFDFFLFQELLCFFLHEESGMLTHQPF